MITDADIGWLAGLFDGEGCVFVHRTRKARGHLVYSINLVLANTSALVVDRYVSLLKQADITTAVIPEARFTKRPIFYVKVRRKHDALTLGRLLLQQATGVASADEVAVLDEITRMKRGAAMKPAVQALLNN